MRWNLNRIGTVPNRQKKAAELFRTFDKQLPALTCQATHLRFYRVNLATQRQQFQHPKVVCGLFELTWDLGLTSHPVSAAQSGVRTWIDFASIRVPLGHPVSIDEYVTTRQEPERDFTCTELTLPAPTCLVLQSAALIESAESFRKSEGSLDDFHLGLLFTNNETPHDVQQQVERAETVNHTDEEEGLSDSHLDRIFNNKASLAGPALVKSVIKSIQTMEETVKRNNPAAAVKALSVKLAALHARFRNDNRSLPGVECLNDILSTLFAMWGNGKSVLR